MNTRPTEFRTLSDAQLQNRMNRALAARRAAEAAREERFRTLPTPRMSQGYTPKPAPLRVVKSVIATYLLILIVSALVTLGWTATAVQGFVEMLRAQP